MARLEVESEVQGRVWKIEVAVGDQVEEGEVLIILESMKMEIPVESPAAGSIVELRVELEEAIDEDQVLAVLESG